MDYKTLTALPARKYLDWQFFRTDWDVTPARAEKAYQKGVETGKSARYVFISANGTWGAVMLDGGMITSYEGIGYHAHTADLLHGFIDSGAAIVVYRYGAAGATQIAGEPVDRGA
jgi:hypothetical protein